MCTYLLFMHYRPKPSIFPGITLGENTCNI